MQRTIRRPLTVLVALICLGSYGTPSLTAAPAPEKNKRSSKKKQKIPTPAQQLAKAYKTLGKTRNYKTVLTVEGGLSRTKDHKLFKAAVRKSYNGQIYSRLLSVPAEKTYKLATKGVRFHQGFWRNVNSDPDGKMLNNFFRFPKDVLAQAMRHVKTARWIDGPAAANDKKADAQEAEPSRSRGKKPRRNAKDERGGSGKTVVSEADAEASDDDTIVMPRVLVIEAPTKEALSHYLMVENSGCLGGG